MKMLSLQPKNKLELWLPLHLPENRVAFSFHKTSLHVIWSYRENFIFLLIAWEQGWILTENS